MTNIPEWIHEHNDGAFPQNVCLVATVSDDGMPSIGPKGSVLVCDDETRASTKTTYASFGGLNA